MKLGTRLYSTTYLLSLSSFGTRKGTDLRPSSEVEVFFFGHETDWKQVVFVCIKIRGRAAAVSHQELHQRWPRVITAREIQQHMLMSEISMKIWVDHGGGGCDIIPTSNPNRRWSMVRRPASSRSTRALPSTPDLIATSQLSHSVMIIYWSMQSD